MKEKELIDKIIDSLINHSNEWFIGKHRANHKSGIEFWIANGAFFISVSEPFNYTPGLLSIIKLWSAIRQAKRNIINEKLTKGID